MYKIYILDTWINEFQLFKTYKRRRYAIDFVENHKGLWKLIDSQGQEFFYETNSPGNYTFWYNPPNYIK